MGLFRSSDIVNAAEEARRAMPRTYDAPRPLTASAGKISRADLRSSTKRPYAEWQADAWHHYERVGEVHFGFNLVASILTRVRFYAGAIVEDDQVPVSVVDALDDEDSDVDRKLAERTVYLSNQILGDQLPAMLRSFAINMSVPGECYLARLEKGWTIKSTTELEPFDRGFRLNTTRSSSDGAQMLPPDTFVARIWRQHPRWAKEPDSSMVGIAESCDELLMLNRLTRSVARSRLNAGILYVPDGITVMAAEQTGTEAPDPGNQFVSELLTSMTAPISDEDSAASVVPMVVTGPAELADGIKHLTLDRQNDDWLVSRADRALERILQGIDLPKDVVTGLANIKYTNAITINEDLYKAHIEPMALAFADALTTVYLRPMLRASGFSDEEVHSATIWYDPSEVVVRPNRSDDATQGFDRFLLSPKAWLREHGFGEADAPDEDELAAMLALNKGQLPPDVTAALFQVLLPNVLGAKREESMDQSVVPFPESARQKLEGEA